MVSKSHRGDGAIADADHPLAERLNIFREMATDARHEAARASSAEMRRKYEHLAKSWDELIAEIVIAKEVQQEPKRAPMKA